MGLSRLLLRINLILFNRLDLNDRYCKIAKEMGLKLTINRGRRSRGIQLSTSSGDPHNLALEEERRDIQLIANDITRLISDANHQRWHLAFLQKNLDRRLEMINTNTKKILGKYI